MKTILKVCNAVALAISAMAAAVLPARAHADLVKSVPAAGSVITAAPKELRLEFDETLVAVGTKVELVDGAGKVIALPKVTLDPQNPKAFTVPAPALSTGLYTVRWTALSNDGHAEKGSYAFTLNLPREAVDVSVRFALRAGKEPLACGKEIAGLGSKRTSAQITDARFHVSNVHLLDAAGKETPVALAADGKWQSDLVALLDFENATGLCRDSGTTHTRDVVLGKVPAGKYTGVVFDLGVPFALNHADVATAKSPLNVKAMWWNWQGGYKFVRIDLKTKSPAPNDAFLIHLGSTGCGALADAHDTGDRSHAAGATTAMSGTKAMSATMTVNDGSAPPTKPCANPNVMTVRLNKFDASRDVIVADVATLLRGVDISNPTPKPAGCMSGVDDADCTDLFPSFGLNLKTGLCADGCRNQRLFRVEAAPASGRVDTVSQ
jgi:uncharacterized repeat protein (TIGR04052 family)